MGPELPQGCTRPAKRMLVQIGRCAYAKQYRRLYRDLVLAQRLPTQGRAGPNKLYSLHAPELRCISKGKAHKRYEFGPIVGIVGSQSQKAVHPGRPCVTKKTLR